MAEDSHSHSCKEYVSSVVAGWDDLNHADAKAGFESYADLFYFLNEIA